MRARRKKYIVFMKMLKDYADHYLRDGEEGQGTVEYTILSGVAVIGLVIAFQVTNVGAALATWLTSAVNGVEASSNAAG